MSEHVPPPPRAVAPIVIAHVSDLHVGAHVPEVVGSLVMDVAATAPALTVITGDLTMRARPAQFLEASALLDRLPAPHLVVLGNHDVPLAPARRLRIPYARYQAQIHQALDPVLQIPGVRALGVNSMPRWRWKAGRVSRRQAELVADVLGGAPPGMVRLLALHHPLSSRGPAHVLGRGPLLHALVEAHVDLVLAGHTHLPATHRLTLPGAAHHVLEVTAGTATSRRDRRVGRSWTLIHVHSDAIHVQERRHVGSGWEGRGTARYARHLRLSVPHAVPDAVEPSPPLPGPGITPSE